MKSLNALNFSYELAYMTGEIFLAFPSKSQEEENQFVANGIVGAIPHHPLIKHYLGLIERNFIGSGELVFQQGVYLWTELTKHSEWSKGVKLYPPDWFLPYNHQTKQTNITENTHTMHYLLLS